MKLKILSFFLFAGVCSQAYSQITVTSADMPNVDLLVKVANDTLMTQSAGPGGTNLVWNFAGLPNHRTDTSLFIHPTWTAYAATFPAANLATQESDSSIGFYNISSSVFEVLGVVAPFAPGQPKIPVVFSTPLKYLELPSTYQSAYSGNTSFDFKFPFPNPPADSAQFKRKVTYTSVVDAWGSISTPAGTFNCIRQKFSETNSDSIWIHVFGNWMFAQDTVSYSVSYRWFANNVKFPVVEMLTDTNGATMRTTWLLAIPAATGLKGLPAENHETVSYPNPASSFITIDASSSEPSSMLEVFDISGRKMPVAEISSSKTTLDVSGYNNGIYFYTITNRGNQVSQKGRFIVSR